MSETKKVEKYSMSPLERWYEDLCHKLEPIVPQCIKPNQITMMAFGGSLLAGVSFFLAGSNKLWFIFAVLGVFIHMTLDNVDGAVARKRNLTSQRGQFLDIFTDSLGIAAIFLGIGFSSYASMSVLIFPMIAWYLHMILMYNWILLKNKWIFPYISNFELHVTVSILAIIQFFTGGFNFAFMGCSFGLFDAVIAISVIFSFLELFYSAVKLYREL